MKLRAYSVFAPTGLDWMPRLPSHWKVKPLKAVVAYNPEALPEDTSPDYEMEYIEISSVSYTTGIEATERHTFEKAPSRARRIVRDGDTIVSTVRTYLKAVATLRDAPDNLIASTGFVVLRPAKEIDAGFLGYYAKSQGFVDAIVAQSVGVSYPATNASDVVRLPVPIPPTDEQLAIARFLDAKTAEIDALIAKKRRLLDLLAEQRAALITRTVTKGLDPAAPVKPSGLQWFGDIPAHWNVKRLDSICDFQSGKAHEPFIDPDGAFICVMARFISTNGLAEKRCTQNLCPATPGDILMVMSDLPNGRALARTFLVDDRAKYAVNQRVCRIRPKKGLAPYFSYQLNRNPQLLRYDDGNEQTHLPNAAFKQLLLLEPPSEEQERIVAYVDPATARIDALVERVNVAIASLQEDRSALITAAVTGQIDVRNWSAKRAAA